MPAIPAIPAIPAMLAMLAMPAMPPMPDMPKALPRKADIAPDRMAGSKPLAAQLDWWLMAAWPNCWLMAECWLVWRLLNEEAGGGVLHTAVSANDQIFGLLGGIGMPDLPSSTDPGADPLVAVRWCDKW